MDDHLLASHPTRYELFTKGILCHAVGSGDGTYYVTETYVRGLVCSKMMDLVAQAYI